MSPRFGLIVMSLVLALLVVALVQIVPDKADDVGVDGQTDDLIVPQLSSTEALAAWHGNPQASEPSENTNSREQLTQAWNTFRGKFSPLPRFDELPATFRIRSLAAGHGEGNGFTIAMHSKWDAETIADKLRPFRKQLSTLAAYRVDIDRLGNGVLVETHEIKPSGKIYILRYASWVIATNFKTNIPALATAAVQQMPGEAGDITPATYNELSDILKTYYKIDNEGKHDE